MFKHGMQLLPDKLQDVILPLLNDLVSKNILSDNTIPDEITYSLPKVWVLSEFVTQNCLRHEGLLQELIDSGDLLVSYQGINDFQIRFDKLTASVETEQQLMAVLRQFRRREMTRIVWRDLSGWADLIERRAKKGDTDNLIT